MLPHRIKSAESLADGNSDWIRYISPKVTVKPNALTKDCNFMSGLLNRYQAGPTIMK